jgi:hypothetical protein
MYGCPQHFYRSTCSNDLKVRQEWLEKQLLSDLQQAILLPEAIDYALQEFQRHLDSVLVSAGQDRERKNGRKNELREQLQRLTGAVAESGHSASLLQAIAEREQELAEIEKSFCQESANGSLQAEELRKVCHHPPFGPSGASLLRYPASPLRASSSHRFRQNDSDGGGWQSPLCCGGWI